MGYKIASLLLMAAILPLPACEQASNEPYGRTLVTSDLVVGDGKILAECGPQSGHAYYPEAGLISAEDSGWTKDQISDGGTILVRNQDGSLDVRWVDTTKKVYSAVDEGGAVTLHRAAADEITVLVAYPFDTLEIYQFVKTKAGTFEMLQLQSKGGMISKAGVLVGQCNPIDFGTNE